MGGQGSGAGRNASLTRSRLQIDATLMGLAFPATGHCAFHDLTSSPLPSQSSIAAPRSERVRASLTASLRSGASLVKPLLIGFVAIFHPGRSPCPLETRESLGFLVLSSESPRIVSSQAALTHTSHHHSGVTHGENDGQLAIY